MTVPSFEHLNVSLSDCGSVVHLEFDHGKANEMGLPQLTELERLLDWLDGTGGIVALVSYSRRLSRKGTPIFIAGANVTERGDWEQDRVMAHVRWQRQVLTRLRNAPVFHICVVGGVALGWGTEFLLTADYRLGADRAIFGLPETGLGILPGAGGTSELWMHIGIAHALRLGMTGERISADEAGRIGLIQERVVDISAGLERAAVLCALAKGKSPTAAATFKRALLHSLGSASEERMALESDAYEHCVRSGQAAIGRTHFDDIRKGKTPLWGGRVLLD
jgi:enoyl-CoA hydratase/carnithine racemase